MNIKTEKIVWKDRIFVSELTKGELIVSIVIFISMSFLSIIAELVWIAALGVLSLVVEGFTLYYKSREIPLLTKEGIISEGVMISRDSPLGRVTIEKKYPRELFSWGDVKELSIGGERISGASYVSHMLTFLSISLKSGKTRKCRIYDPNGFVQAIKRMGKINLLTKRTREKYI